MKKIVFNTAFVKRNCHIKPSKINDIVVFLNVKNNKKISTKRIVIGLVGGLFVGFLSGFFGGGGGMIVVPLLIFALGLTEKKAHATAIFTILPISIASSVVYLINKNVPFYELGFATIGFVVGGVIGALLLKKINNKILRVIFAVIMIAAGIKIVI